MIAAIVFDFDGVLVDSEPLHLRAYQEVLEPRGISLPREEYYARYLGFDDREMFRAVGDARGWHLDDREITALIELKSTVFAALVKDGNVFYPGAVECVNQLATRWPLGIASGAFRHEIEMLLGARALRDRFRFIVGAGDTAAGKPSPDPYLKAATLHGVPPEACLAIEDSRWGIESAKVAGLFCIGITNSYPVSELLEADAIIASLDELTPKLIQSLG